MEVEAPPPPSLRHLNGTGGGAAAGLDEEDAAAGEDVVFVPLQGEETTEAVTVPIGELPEDPDDVLNMLSCEAAHIQCWLDTAKGYLSRGMVKPFLDILGDALSDDVLGGIASIYGREPRFERVQLLCALAAYYTEAARVEADPANKAAAMARAERHAAEAAGVAPGEMLPVMARGMLALAKGDSTAALVEFRRAAALQHNGSKNHAPLLAQAAVHFNAGNMAAALHAYATVLRENPGCPAEVRLGIGACYYRAGKVEAAAAAYNRVLALHPGCADALLGLAMIKFGSREVQEGLNAGLQLLQRAFACDPSHPGVLVVLGHFSLLKGSYDQAYDLARAALEGADTSKLRVAALTLMGRCEHARGRMDLAQQHYANAIRLDPSQPLAHLGFAQVYLASGGDPTNVVSELETVLQQLQGNSDALMLLGGLLPVKPERVAKTLAAHKEAASRQVHDPALQEILGELLANTDPAGALAAFDQAVALRRAQQAAVAARNEARAARRQALREQQAAGALGLEEAARRLADVGEDDAVPPLPAKLLNNTAVLKYRSGDVGAALGLMQEAMASVKVDGTPPTHVVTMGYNIARLQEASGDLKAASEGYTSLVGQFPGYIDCYLRLAAMARAAGEAGRAREWADAAAQQAAGGDVDAQATLATLHLHRGSLQEARECITRAQQAAPEARGDPYLLLTHANVVLASLRPDPPSRLAARPEEARRQHDSILKALDNYRAVLKVQPDNIYAVNGIGACMAELGHLSAAKAAFDEVVRATSRTQGFVSLPETYTNLGHVWLARRQAADALRMYALAGRQQAHGQQDLRLLSLTARAHLDAKQHGAARRALLRATHMFPWDPKTRFNLAFMLQEEAAQVLMKTQYADGDLNKHMDYARGVDALVHADRMFQYSHGQGKDYWARMGVDGNKLRVHKEFCEASLPRAMAMLRQANDEARTTQARNKVLQAEFAKAEADRQYKEGLASAAKRSEEERKLAEAKRVLAESRAKVEALRQQRAQIDDDGAAPGGTAAKGKKRKKGGGGGGSGTVEEEFYVDDGAPIERLPKKKDVKAELKRGGLDSDDDDEDDDAAADPDVEGLFGSDAGSDGDGDDAAQQQQDGDDGDGQQGARRTGGGGRLKRRAAAEAGGMADGGEEEEEEEDVGDEDWGGGAGGSGGAAGTPAAEGLGENDAGTFQVDALFADEPSPGGGAEEEGQEGGADGEQQQQQQPRKRQRQTLGSDDEADEDAAAAAGGGGDGDAMVEEEEF